MDRNINYVDARWMCAAAEMVKYWKHDYEREKFADFARPYWMEKGGEALVDYMMEKYVHNGKSPVEYLYNLDRDNKKIVVLYLRQRAEDWDPDNWVVKI